MSATNTPLPFQLSVTGRSVLLIGDGEAAIAKHRLLAERGAQLEHWTATPTASQKRAVEIANEDPATRFVLAVIADDAAWARELIDWVNRERMLLNVVDAPSQSAGFIPAIVSRGNIQVGIGSGGTSPVLARYLRTRIEHAVPAEVERLSHLTQRWQTHVRSAIPEVQTRRLFWEQVLAGPVADAAIRGDAKSADRQVERMLSNHNPVKGHVSLVGAGPGEAGLFTLKGLSRLQQADVVLYDKLVSPDVLALARRDAVLEDVGKRRGLCPMPQDAICARLVELGKQGLRVCRLKGGDPLMFGRGGEEAMALAAANVSFDIVPGITTAAAVAASTGMPLTHRGIARSVRFITGHLALTEEARSWQALAAEQETVVLYMGFSHLRDIASSLIAAGVPKHMPIAAVQNAARSDQTVVRATLANSACIQQQLNLEDGPIIILIGQVTALSLGIASDQAHEAINTPLHWTKSA